MLNEGRRIASACAIAALAAATTWSSAHAAGYAVKETSATLQGTAFAGAASGGEDISAIFNNPASVGLYGGRNTSLNGAVIFPSADMTVEAGGATTVLGTPIAGTTSSDANDLALVPATYGSIQLTDRINLGFGITSPFGLVTDFGEEWQGRYHATNSELLTVNINPVIGFQATPWLTLGAGFVAQYASATLENEIDFGTLEFARAGAAMTAPTAGVTPGTRAFDGSAKVKGDDWGFGYTFGAIIHPTEQLRFGIAYRSEVEHELGGDLEIRTPTTGNPALDGLFQAIANGSGLVNQSATASATIPAQVNIGASFDVTPQLTIAAEADWTQWSSFEDLVVEGSIRPEVTRSTLNYDDSWFFSAGVKYDVNDKLTLRAGIAHDQGAANDEFRTPRIPDADRWWFSVGAGYQLFDHTRVNLGYTYVMVDDAPINLEATPNPADENFSRGNLSANSEGGVHVFVFNGTINF